jgi:YD repeat-containing protein
VKNDGEREVRDPAPCAGHAVAATDNSWWSYPAATATTVSYTANNLDQYTAVGAVTSTYDGNGNLTYDGTFTYGYDAESRLTSVTQSGTTVATYAYDALGHRKSKTVGTATTIYVRDGGNRALLDYNGATGAVLDWYAFTPGRTTPSPNSTSPPIRGRPTSRTSSAR